MDKRNPGIGRRAFLKSAGATLLLPATAGIAYATGAKEAARQVVPSAGTPRRLCAMFVGNGVALPPPEHPTHSKWHWFPHEVGANFNLTGPLEPLHKVRDQFSVISGLSHPALRTIYAHSTAAYFLTGADPQSPAGNTISMDQVLAQYAGSQTLYPSLTIGTEGGVGDVSRSNTMSYMQNGQPIPALGGTPRAIFNELFSVDTRDKGAQVRGFDLDRSMLDAAVQQVKSLQSRLGAEDKQRLDEYLTSVRGVETRIDRAEAWLDVPKPEVSPDLFQLDADPVYDGPAAFLDAMYQLVHTAFVTDATRIVTFQAVGEGAGAIAKEFPKALGMNSIHHELTHQYDKTEEGWENWARYDQFQVARLAAFLEMLASTDDPYADGSLLDNTIVLYGSGTSATHITKNYPIIVAGGRNMGLVHGIHRQYDDSIPFANLLLTILQTLGAPDERFADSTGTLDLATMA
jgi:hypothetical protein